MKVNAVLGNPFIFKPLVRMTPARNPIIRKECRTRDGELVGNGKTYINELDEGADRLGGQL